MVYAYFSMLLSRKDVSDMNVISVNLPSIYAQKDLLRNITQQPNVRHDTKDVMLYYLILFFSEIFAS